MESDRKWVTDPHLDNKKDGIYVHYSPPKVFKAGGSVKSQAQVRQWARAGDAAALERAVLAGQGRRVLMEPRAQTLVKRLKLEPLMHKCDAIHAAVERGSLFELQDELESEFNKRKFASCRDEAGVGLLHKAVYYGFLDIAEWLVRHFPHLVNQRDSEGRTALHYAAATGEEATALLEGAGAVRGVRDGAGHTPAYYRAHPRSHLVLPAARTPAMPRDHTVNPSGLMIKRSNIRIWCHDCDMGKLQRVVWDGHGARLLSEVSNQPVVRRFLEAVPYIMNTIRDIHYCVIQNDLEGLMKLAGDPVPPLALSSRDANNLTVTHKAAGLGHVAILKYITNRYPQGLNDTDIDGRTPLHYAAASKEDMHAYNTLIILGADESILDNRNKTAAYYIGRTQEIEKGILKLLPEAPRTPSSVYPSSWDWSILDIQGPSEYNKKPRRRNVPNHNTRHYGGMKQSSTHEYISTLPVMNEKTRSKSDEHISSIQEPEVNVNKDSLVNVDNDLIDTQIHDPEIRNNDEVQNSQTNESLENINETPDDENGANSLNQIPVSIINDNNHMNNSIIDELSKTTISEPEETSLDNLDEPNDNIEKNTKQPNQLNDSTEKLDMDNDINEEAKEEPAKYNDHLLTENNELPNNDILNKTVDEDDEIYENEMKDKKGEDYSPDHNVEAENKLDNYDDDTEVDSIIAKNDSEHSYKNTNEETIKNQNQSKQNEDDEDVQVLGESQSEYSDTNQRSTAEASDGNALGGNSTSGRGTQESLIEGVVNEESEMDSQDASIVHDDADVKGGVVVVEHEIDPEVTNLIRIANMEMLAALVLNGEGSRLIGRTSHNFEVQAFLDSVPTYMKKIKKVHLAARDGNIRELQAALDRRKFAIARDLVSPMGATPLHVATVFGKTNIIKYLGGRFPETLSAVDFEGRTALHYAAVLPDNGHYYNLLQQLGANSKDLDDNGRSAEEYQKNPSLLSFHQLASDFGLNEDAMQTMLSDRVLDDRVSSRRTLDDEEELETLDRCFRLLASSKSSRPALSASSNKTTPPLVLARFLQKSVFKMVKTRITKLDHNLFDVIWPAVKKLPSDKHVVQTVEEDYMSGVSAPDYYVYTVFAEFLGPLIKDIHNINVSATLSLHPQSDYDMKNLNKTLNLDNLFELNIDPDEKFVLSGVIECTRNITNFELPLNLTIGQLEEVENIITNVIMSQEFSDLNDHSNTESDQRGGSYYTLIEILDSPSEIRSTLASTGLLIALCDNGEVEDAHRIHGRHWPYGRGVYVSDDKEVAIWINVHDHLRVFTCTPAEDPGEIGMAFNRLWFIMSYLHKHLTFVWDPILGHLSNRPNFLGNATRFSLLINFKYLSKDADNLKLLCSMRGLQYKETLCSTIGRVSNYQCLGITETACFNDFVTAVSNLLHLERELSKTTNSAQIATLLTNIFKKKRNSLVSIESDIAEK